MFTRAQYMSESHEEFVARQERGGKHYEPSEPNADSAHNRYYSQFVTPEIKRKVLSAFGLSKLRESFAIDQHFNSDITPLRAWDAIKVFTSTDKALRECGDYLTLGNQVCITKQAAYHILAEKGAK